MHRVVALLLVLDENRELGEVDVPFLRIVFAGNGAQVDDLEILAFGQPDPIDIGSWLPASSIQML